MGKQSLTSSKGSNSSSTKPGAVHTDSKADSSKLGRKKSADQKNSLPVEGKDCTKSEMVHVGNKKSETTKSKKKAIKGGVTGASPGAVSVSSKESTLTAKLEKKKGLSNNLQQQEPADLQIGALRLNNSADKSNLKVGGSLDTPSCPLAEHVDSSELDPTMVKGEPEISVADRVVRRSSTTSLEHEEGIATSSGPTISPTSPLPMHAQLPIPTVRRTARGEKERRRGALFGLFRSKKK
jgi:hypothetical protein